MVFSDPTHSVDIGRARPLRSVPYRLRDGPAYSRNTGTRGPFPSSRSLRRRCARRDSWHRSSQMGLKWLRYRPASTFLKGSCGVWTREPSSPRGRPLAGFPALSALRARKASIEARRTCRRGQEEPRSPDCSSSSRNASRISSICTICKLPGIRRRDGAASTAQRSDAQDARSARFSCKANAGSLTTSIG
jgi:hypothetical protein